MIDNSYQQRVINSIKESNGATIPIIISDLIKSNSTNKSNIETLWSEYLGDVPILRGDYINNPARPQNRLTSGHRNIVTQQIIGYMFGEPINMSIPEDATNNYVKAEQLFKNFLTKNYYDKLDAELESHLSVTGVGFRLLYYTDVVDYLGKKSVEIIMKNINPWESIVIVDSSLQEPVYGLIYYPVQIVVNNNTTTKIKAEFYDSKNVYYFIEGNNGNFVPDDTYGDSVQFHGFTSMPVIKFQNNSHSTGDWTNARSLMDAYDRVNSFGVNDFESYANAYLIYYGIQPDEEQIQLARKTGAFYVPKDNDSDANNDIKFLTKEMNTTNLKDILTTLNDNIYKMCASVDMSDDSFGGNQSGESRKYKLIPLENKSKEKERWLKFGYKYLFKVAVSFWAQTAGVKIDYSKIEMTFTRSLPLDLTVADINTLYTSGIISHETALESLGFIENIDDEMEQIEEEKGNTSETPSDEEIQSNNEIVK